MVDVNKLVAQGFTAHQAKAIADQVKADDKPKTKGPKVADSEATTIAALRDDFNGLLASLRKAGAIS